MHYLSPFRTLSLLFLNETGQWEEVAEKSRQWEEGWVKAHPSLATAAEKKGRETAEAMAFVRQKGANI